MNQIKKVEKIIARLGQIIITFPNKIEVVLLKFEDESPNNLLFKDYSITYTDKQDIGFYTLSMIKAEKNSNYAEEIYRVSEYTSTFEDLNLNINDKSIFLKLEQILKVARYKGE